MLGVVNVFSAILLLFVLLVYFIVALVADVLMKGLYLAHQEPYVRKIIYVFSKGMQLLLKLWGTQIYVEECAVKIPTPPPIIFVASHHSSLDILLLINALEKDMGQRKLGFVSRQGLDQWLPCISFYLRKYCYSLKGTLKNRDECFQSDQVLLPKFAQALNAQKDCVIIFPEGVKPIKSQEYCRRFNRNGLRVLIKNMPDAVIIPIAITGSGNFYTTPRKFTHFFQNLPRFFSTIHISILAPIKASSIEQKIDGVQDKIFAEFNRLNDSLIDQQNKKIRKRKWIR
jgi:1-acyl-sn-glycerol-3-phosphate acyltransferase